MPLKWAPDLLTKSVLDTWKQVMSNNWLLIICTDYTSTSYAQCLAHSRNLNICWLISYRHLKLNSFITNSSLALQRICSFSWSYSHPSWSQPSPLLLFTLGVSPQPTVFFLRLCIPPQGMSSSTSCDPPSQLSLARPEEDTWLIRSSFPGIWN